MSEAALRLLDQNLPRVEMYSPAFRRRVLDTRKRAAADEAKAAGEAEVALRKVNRAKALQDAKATRESEREMLMAARKMMKAREMAFDAAKKVVAAHVREAQLLDEGIPLEPLEPHVPAIDIIKDTALAYGLSVAIIRGPSRSRHVVIARHEAMARVHVARPDLSLPALGRIFNRDHTTLLFALRKLGVRDGTPQSGA